MNLSASVRSLGVVGKALVLGVRASVDGGGRGGLVGLVSISSNSFGRKLKPIHFANLFRIDYPMTKTVSRTEVAFLCQEWNQGCQVVYFQTKIPNLG
jgi:hypothetical protein